jgi:hypothetical protein
MEIKGTGNMDIFQHAYDLKLNQEDINRLNRSITSNGIEAVIKTLLSKENPRTRLIYC